MPSTDGPRTGSVRPVVDLIRRWVVDFFNRHDASVCHEFMSPDYALCIGEHTLRGRDSQYVPAVQQQFDQFPNLAMTVHRVLVGANQVALEFTEHGASGGTGGRVASWSGIALYHSNGKSLDGCVAQEDYQARQRQLKSGMPDPVAQPCAAPWDQLPQASDVIAQDIVRNWLKQSWPAPSPLILCDDEHIEGVAPLVFDVSAVDITDLFSAGTSVAFHARQTGTHISGLPGVGSSDRQATMCCAGIVTVVDGQVQSGRVIRDRAGLRRALLAG